jgi:hypothetical protein
MGNTSLLVEIMDGSDIWRDVTTDVMAIKIDGLGLTKPRGVHSYVANCKIKFNNVGKSYSPPVTAPVAELLEVRRRVRIRATGQSSGNALQMIRTGAYGLGGTLTVAESGGGGINVGDQSSVDYLIAMSFKPVAGQLSQIKVGHNVNVGAPSGTITWAICADNAGAPGTVLQTGTYTPTASATNTISVGSGIGLDSTLTYWLRLAPTTNQSANNRWTVNHNTTTYANGIERFSTNGGTSWTTVAGFWLDIAITTVQTGAYFGQSQIQTVNNGEKWTLQWEARAQYDSQYNGDAVRVQTNTQTGAFNSFSYTNKWATYSFDFNATSNGTSIECRFYPQFAGSSTSTTAIEYRNFSLKKTAGANILFNGDLSSGTISPWSGTVVVTPSSVVTISVIPDYWTLFNGFIDDIMPAPHALAGLRSTEILCVDWTEILRGYGVDKPIQKDQTGDQLIATVLTLLPSGTNQTTLPGKQLDAGRQTFQRAFDGYTKDTSIMDAVDEVTASSFGRQWTDRDGTFRWTDRDDLPKRVSQTPKLTLTDGLPYMARATRNATTIVNDVILTYHPPPDCHGPDAIGSDPGAGEYSARQRRRAGPDHPDPELPRHGRQRPGRREHGHARRDHRLPGLRHAQQPGFQLHQRSGLCHCQLHGQRVPGHHHLQQLRYRHALYHLLPGARQRYLHLRPGNHHRQRRHQPGDLPENAPC